MIAIGGAAAASVRWATELDIATFSWPRESIMTQWPVPQFPEGDAGMVCDASVAGDMNIGIAKVIGTIGVIATPTISICCIGSGIGMADAICMGQKLPSSRVVI